MVAKMVGEFCTMEHIFLWAGLKMTAVPATVMNLMQKTKSMKRDGMMKETARKNIKKMLNTKCSNFKM